MAKAPPLSRRVFNKYDTDGSGQISVDEFKSMVYDMGYCLSEQELKMALLRLDSNGDKHISYDEFLNWWSTEDRFTKLQLNQQQAEKLEKSAAYFRYFDKDGSGVLDRKEFSGLHADLVKNKLINKSLDQTLEELDTNRDGQISFNEYIDWLTRRGAFKQ